MTVTRPENKQDHFRFQSTTRFRDRDSESDSLSLSSEAATSCVSGIYHIT